MACTKPVFLANLKALGVIHCAQPIFTIVNKPYAKKPQPNAPRPEEHWGDEPSLAAFVAGANMREVNGTNKVCWMDLYIYLTGSRK